MDLIRASPYRPAAYGTAANQGLTHDRTRSHAQCFRFFLAKRLASTQELDAYNRFQSFQTLSLMGRAFEFPSFVGEEMWSQVMAVRDPGKLREVWPARQPSRVRNGQTAAVSRGG
ncbi:hypothetical protein MES4922_40344 [Mesorhizobium ventifaucium]|uniref:Uncharacterized protein n=1 Tax=Mesorhizobium ventifaucium TaxID=666020 RepID=A0ABN8K5U5_9HYPH|nr:hypothetical protein MES4922_40344 [Mesorhizobium ventifaucium]